MATDKRDSRTREFYDSMIFWYRAVLATVVAVTGFFMAAQYYRIDSLEKGVQQLQIDVAKIKEHLHIRDNGPEPARNEQTETSSR